MRCNSDGLVCDDDYTECSVKNNLCSNNMLNLSCFGSRTADKVIAMVIWPFLIN